MLDLRSVAPHQGIRPETHKLIAYTQGDKEHELYDLKNDPDAWAQAGAVTAALFLQRFAPAGAWAHFDLFGWNGRARPGWPAGAEAQTIRAVYAWLKSRYA